MFFEFFFVSILLSLSQLRKSPKSTDGETPRLLWGSTPILNFKYWNEAIKLDGYDSKTFMSGFYSRINKESDFDLYFNQIHTPFVVKLFQKFLPQYKAIGRIHLVFYIARNFDIIHTTYDGLCFANTKLWNIELDFYRRNGLKIVVIPYGSDYQMYSKLYNKSWHHGLLMNYPEGIKREKNIKSKIEYFVEHADCIMAGFQFDQISRWDILPYAVYPMDTQLWRPKKEYSEADGINGTVKIYHTPNHRGTKGTEFLIKAVDELKTEGLKVELFLLENLQNEDVREHLYTEADILVEQLILGFALSALEGMATGLPVVSNLEEDENEIKLFRRYSYLNECPIYSSNPEKIKDTLRNLVTHPSLRKELGLAGVAYVEKYHSFRAMGDIFKAIYDKIWYKKDIDLMNFFNPIHKDSYNNKSPIITHPFQKQNN